MKRTSRPCLGSAGVRARRALLYVLLAPTVAAAAGPKPSPTVVYLGATVITGTAPTAQPDMAVVTRGERIIAVVPAAGFSAGADAQTVDVRGKYIIPGLINAHVHVATLAEPPVARAYLKRELYSGVTTVRDMAGDARLLAELQRESEFDEIPSPAIYFSAVMAGPGFFVDPRTHDAARGRTAGAVPWMQAITPKTDLRLAVAAARATGATGIKLYADLPAPLIRAITAEAHRQRLRVWAHAAVFPATPSEVVDAGVDAISHACMLAFELSEPPVQSFETARPIDMDKVGKPSAKMDALFRAIKARGTVLDATLFVYESPGSRACPPGSNDTLARQAFRAGIPIAAGTDDDPDWADPDSKLDAEIELLVAKLGMTPAEALRSATVISARAVGLESEVGAIKAGRMADLVVLDRNPLADIANVRSVDFVVKHGRRYPRSSYRPATEADFKSATE